ncbi:hypothetical protein C2G38_2151763 [Gigaspora rosea]|uniref:Uncharacterized protein n=1 Tax=Gigaspora rosea TaxID=44941 RepID=A0A397W8W7_9GLOM|nr:hypothetical protein C2G38_2151763 [Gigaspora rosea]
MLQKYQKVLKGYLEKWKLFNSWLLDPLINIQIKILVQFSILFYEPLTQFFIGQDPVPQIFSRNKLKKLPYGCQARKIPDKANKWLNFLIEMKANFYIFFANTLYEALNILSEQEFEVLVEQLEYGLEKAIERSDLGQSYAYALIHVIFKNSWLKSPAEQEIAYSNQIQEDYD